MRVEGGVDRAGGVPVCAGVPGVKPVLVELTDFKTKEKVDELEVDAVLVATGRAPYTQVQLWGLSPSRQL